MTTFTLIVLITFITALASQFIVSVEKGNYLFMFLFMFEIIAFAYLANIVI